MKKVCLLSLLSVCYMALAAQNKSLYLLLGTYTKGKSEGLYVYKFDTKTGTATYTSHIASSNPSFIAVAPGNKFVYAVNEDADSNGTGGRVSAYQFDAAKGQLTLLNQQPSGGNHPCYVTVDKTNRWVLAGNYNSGSMTVLPIQKNGALGNITSIIVHEGKGPNSPRQDKPHVHGTFLANNNKDLFVPDLGIDKVMVYRFNAANGSVAALPPIATEPGGGPRHLAIHPNGKFLYLVQELLGSIAVYSYPGKDSAKLLQTHSALPLTYKGPLSGADIHISPDGKFLYSSNRGNSNTIAIFSINSKTGQITLLAHQPVLGLKPRNFNFDPSGNYLLVANQDSDEVVIFKRNKKTGLLINTGNRITVGNPVCIKWIW
jgi:6-phosphogluconolactonase